MVHALPIGYDLSAMGIDEQRARARERAATARTAFSETLDALTDGVSMSRTDLADAVKVDESTLSRYCSGKQEPKIGVAAAIADALGVSLDYMTSGDRRQANKGNVPERRVSLRSVDEGDPLAELAPPARQGARRKRRGTGEP